jgi:hypothetical protein
MKRPPRVSFSTENTERQLNRMRRCSATKCLLKEPPGGDAVHGDTLRFTAGNCQHGTGFDVPVMD